ncbi:MAG: Coenzyme F420 hydrogenase/dehydrogenase, beta subunit C-terminal domain, partial [Lachnospiraceae bacterium]|nr:Coenzyme F420 hydrogenase/dehydrogenase, beta subunit C-terminal domain [Lachnospiraceae bacterium]
MEEINKNAAFPVAYACCNRSREERVRSSSGGIFYLLGSQVLEQSGVVFGAKWNDEWELVHGEAHNREELEAFLGSKYVQSDLKDTFLRVRDYLEEGRTVLFSGTPCQTAGLKCFLAKEEKREQLLARLITADLICHGVPSPAVWRRYLREIRKNRTVTGINFRDKTRGWRDFSLKIDYLSHTPYCKKRYSDMYLRGFLKNIDLRPSCHSCSFKADRHMADITLGDFWGVEQYCPELSDDTGVSAVLVWSEKGMDLIGRCSGQMVKKTVSAEIIGQTNSAYVRSVAPHPERNQFFKELPEADQVKKLLRKRTKGTLWQRIIGRLLRHPESPKEQTESRIPGSPWKPDPDLTEASRTGGSMQKKNGVPVLYKTAEECCGCTACQASCPKQAIEMKEDREGFLYPWIDDDKCVGCCRCVSICP